MQTSSTIFVLKQKNRSLETNEGRLQHKLHTVDADRCQHELVLSAAHAFWHEQFTVNQKRQSLDSDTSLNVVTLKK